MLMSEFLELLYYHIVWHWDKGLIIAQLFIVVYHLIRCLMVLKDIRDEIEDQKMLSLQELKKIREDIEIEKDQTNKCESDPESVHQGT